MQTEWREDLSGGEDMQHSEEGTTTQQPVRTRTLQEKRLCNVQLGFTINCRKQGPVYEIFCNDCKEALETPEKKYRGQTGRTNYHRMKEPLHQMGKQKRRLGAT